jgi:hypothetical protein
LDDIIVLEHIRDVVLRYSRPMDRHDVAEMELVSRPDSGLDYVMSKGSGADFSTSYVGWHEQLGTKVTAHNIHNCLVRLDGDRAFAETYFQAYHRGAAPGSDQNTLVAGRHQDVFERRDAEWRIAARSIVFDWSRAIGPSCNSSAGTLGITAAASRIGGYDETPWTDLISRLS